MKYDVLTENNIFEKSNCGNSAFYNDSLYSLDNISEKQILGEFLRDEKIGLPDISERDMVKHFSDLADRTFSLDAHLYPLGSCTMKYNPKVNEDISSFSGFTDIHPLQDDEDVQGALQVIYEVERELSFLTGMDNFSMQPAAGAHGELTALFIAKKYFQQKGENRTKIVVPDSSHGTNPASASIAGYDLITISSKNGEVDLDELKKVADENIAVFMLTNPNTLGIFEKNVKQICRIVHDAGGLTYLDGANMNALLGLVKPGVMGFDMMHVNLHKTFATPHGGGGPGSGPVGVKHHLKQFLPYPEVVKLNEIFSFSFDNHEESIGPMKAFWGNFGVILRAHAYIEALGPKGLQETSKAAIINANYLKAKLKNYFNVPFDTHCMHEFVITPKDIDQTVKTIDIAKKLLDFGIHAPTIYFPLIVKEAIMIEPTETESLRTLDIFVEVLIDIAKLCKLSPDIMHKAPENTFRKRLDEVLAARKPHLKWE